MPPVSDWWFLTKRKNFVKLFPESGETLENLRKNGIKLGLLSNSTRFIVMTVLNHFKLRKYFEVVMTMNDVKRRKPDPEMVLKACKKLNINPKNAVIVGDTKNDMIAGNRAGCVTVGYRIKGNYRINDLKEIIKFVSIK